MKKTVIIDVATDFSKTPGGRYESEGEYSGEEFRKKLVEPVLDSGDDVVVDLDGALGFTSSFLEEVFGGLVRKYGTAILARITARSPKRPGRAQKALGYMQRAASQLS